MLDLAQSYMNGRQWEDANKILEDILFNNPNLAQAIWCKLQIKFQAVNDKELLKHANKFTQEDLDLVSKTLNCADKEFATTILDLLYSDGEITLQLLKTILPFNYDNRSYNIVRAIGNCIVNNFYNQFELLLTTLDGKEVDRYINYNLKFISVNKEKNSSYIKQCVNNVLSVDEGNVEALKTLLNIYLEQDDFDNTVKTFETILKYSTNTKKTVYELLDQIQIRFNSNEDCLAFREVLKYYPGELVEIKDLLLDASYAMINLGYFEHAKYILSLIITVDENNPKIYWGLCLVKMKTKTEKCIITSDVSLKSIPEYVKYLSMVDEKRRQECFKIAKQQEEELNKKGQEKERARKRQEDAQKLKKNLKKFGVISGISFAVVAIVLSVVLVIQTVIIPSNKYKKANELLANKNYYEAYQILDELGDYKDSKEILNSITSIIIPDGVTSIESFAFSDCTSLTSIEIPNSVTSIGDYAFYNCTSLTSVTIGNGVTSIGEDAFSRCTSLTSITIPNSVTSIGEDAFYGCTSLTSIEIPNSVTSIGDWVFKYCTSLTSVTIGNSVTSIGDYAFEYCDSLTSVTIGNGVTSIGDYAFYGCTSLTSIEIPNSVTSIGSSAFGDCTSLTIYCEATSKPNDWTSYWNSSCSVVWNCNNNDVATDGYIYTVIDGIRYGIKDGVATVVKQPRNITSANIQSTVTYKGVSYNVTSIEVRAFENCSSLTSIQLPNSVTSIGDYAFYNCSSLTSIEIPNSVTSIGYSAFDDCTSLTIYCEATSKPSGYDSYWHGSCPVVWNCNNNEVADDGCIYKIIDGIRYRLKGGVATVVEQPRNITSANILSTVTYKGVTYNVTSIGSYAFAECRSLTSIEIPNSVTSIGSRAFYYCTSLTSITIPNSVTSIGDYAFWDCTSLTIYCEATSKPNGWAINWNYSNCPVVWGYTGV